MTSAFGCCACCFSVWLIGRHGGPIASCGRRVYFELQPCCPPRGNLVRVPSMLRTLAVPVFRFWFPLPPPQTGSCLLLLWLSFLLLLLVSRFSVVFDLGQNFADALNVFGSPDPQFATANDLHLRGWYFASSDVALDRSPVETQFSGNLTC